MITETNRYMLGMLADVLHDRVPKKVPDGEWQNIYKTMSEQWVKFLPAYFAMYLGLPKEEYKSYYALLGDALQHFSTLIEVEDKLVTLLKESAVHFVVVKGAAAAYNYPYPELRTMGDIDIIVRREDFDRASEVLRSPAFAVKSDCEDIERHIAFEGPDGIEVEMHRYFSEDGKEDNILDNLIFDAFSDIREIEINDSRIPVLPRVENGLVLLEHIRHHLEAGLGLRHVVDWMCFVEKELNNEFWESEFAAVAEKIGLKKLAMTVTAMCRKYLGLSETITWCGEPADVCDELMEYVINRGEFGLLYNKKVSYGDIGKRIIKNPGMFLKYAQTKGIRNWKATQKCPLLRPFAWIYQLFRMAFIALFRREQYGTDQVYMDNVLSNEQVNRKFFDELGV